jgi:hypothetical protein
VLGLCGAVLAAGCTSGGDKKDADRSAPMRLELSLPITVTDLRHEVYGVWPYGIHGGGHPEGHGGFDFELAPTATVRAPLEGTVAKREANTTFIGQEDLALSSLDGTLTVQIGHLRGIPARLQPGTNVTQGEILGRPAAVDNGRFCMIHFSVSRRGSAEPYGEECPLGFLRADARQALEKAFLAIPRDKKDRFEYALCNPRQLSSSDPFVGVWFRIERDDRFPSVLTLTPFVESPGATRVVAMGTDRLSRLGTARAGTGGARAIHVEGWPDLEAALETANPGNGTAQKLVLVDRSTDARASYEPNAYQRLDSP